MSNAYTHLLNPGNTSSGIAEGVWIALAEWFTSPGGLKHVNGGSDPGEEVTITDNHTFTTENGFLKFALAPDKNSFKSVSIGDKGFNKFENTASLFVPGSYKEAHEVVANLKNKQLVVLVKDSTCDEDLFYQLGYCSNFAYLQSEFGTGTVADGVKGYTFTIVSYSDFVTLYAGTVTLASPYLSAPPSLAFSLVTTTEIKSTWAGVEGAELYKLERATRPDFADAVTVYTGTDLEYTNTGLTPGRHYYYRVQALAEGYRGGYYKAGTQNTVLGSPENDGAIGTVTTSGFTLGIIPASGGKPTSYTVQISTDITFASGVTNLTKVFDPSQTPYQLAVITGLTTDTDYHTRVKAVKAGYTDSDWSNTVTTITA
jgi:hypothetical protein